MGDGRVRVLIEHSSALVTLDLREELEAAGFEVLTCPGPQKRPDRCCPLVVEGLCELATGADVIINALGRDQVEVYRAQHDHLPGTPVLVDARPSVAGRLRAVVEHLRSTGPLPGGESLVERIREVLASGRGGSTTSP